MKANVGNADRLVRLVVGLGLIAAAWLNLFGLGSNPVLGYGAMIVGAVLAATSAMRFCPLYRVFGLSTCRL